MDRRKSIKALAIGSISAGMLVEACKNPDKKSDADVKKEASPMNTLDRQLRKKGGMRS